jgi:hypothetical protein
MKFYMPKVWVITILYLCKGIRYSFKSFATKVFYLKEKYRSANKTIKNLFVSNYFKYLINEFPNILASQHNYINELSKNNYIFYTMKTTPCYIHQATYITAYTRIHLHKILSNLNPASLVYADLHTIVCLDPLPDKMLFSKRKRFLDRLNRYFRIES